MLDPEQHRALSAARVMGDDSNLSYMMQGRHFRQPLVAVNHAIAYYQATARVAHPADLKRPALLDVYA